MAPKVFLLLLSLFAFSHAQQKVQSTLLGYDWQAELDQSYILHWTADETNQIMHLALEANTTGWVGFGIAEPTSGSMPGSDIVTGFVNDTDGSISVTDRYAIKKGTPLADPGQDWNLINGTQNTSGWTLLHITRPFDTGDNTNDRPFHSGLVRIIFSYGAGDRFQQHIFRMAAGITFYGTAPVTGSQIANVTGNYTLQFNNFAVPTDVSTYACQSFTIPDSLVHVVNFEPIINNKAIVHHMLVHSCTTNSAWWQQYDPNPGVCGSPVGSPTTQCDSLIFGWALGMGPFSTPDEAGFLLGKGTGAIRFITIEMHYNNAKGASGLVDNSGMRLYYTTTLRPYNAGVLSIGQPVPASGSIPKLSANYTLEFSCSANCTSNLPRTVQVFGSFLHMHAWGSQIFTNRYRSGNNVVVNKIDYWDFNYQQNTEVNYTLQPGDRLNTHCFWNTSNSSVDVTLGTASSQEMCMDFLSYYPAIPNATYCGGFGIQTTVQSCANNPQATAPPGYPVLDQFATGNGPALRIFGSTDTRTVFPNHPIIFIAGPVVPTPSPTPTPLITDPRCNKTYFQASVWPIIRDNAAGGHWPSTYISSGSNVLFGDTPDVAFNALVNHSSLGHPTMLRVKPGDPQNSYLYHKVVGDQLEVGGSFGRMPDGGPPYLTDNEIATIQQWILDGALYQIPASCVAVTPTPTPTPPASPTPSPPPSSTKNIQFKNRTLAFALGSTPQHKENFEFFWSIQDGNLTMAVRAAVDGWLAFGFSGNGGMIGSVAVLGWAASGSASEPNQFIGDYSLYDKTSSNVYIGNTQKLSQKEVWRNTDGTTTLLFTRPLQVSGVPSISSSGLTNVVFAGGPLPTTSDVPAADASGSSTGGHLKQHNTGDGARGYQAQMNFITGAINDTPPSPAIAAHASMMWIGWGLLLPIGILIARHGKDMGVMWFHLHRGIQIVGLLLVIIAWIIGVFVIGSGTYIAHFYCGTVAVALGVLQPLNAIIRPHIDKGQEPTTGRKIWFFVHSMGGRIAVILAMINMLVAISFHKPDFTYQALLVAAIILMALIAVILEIRKIMQPPEGGAPKKLKTEGSIDNVEVELDHQPKPEEHQGTEGETHHENGDTD